MLYRKPQTYARFLGQELFYWYKHELLVVMPNGFGVYKHGAVPARDSAAVAKLAPAGTTNGTALVAAANRAVQKLAELHGLQLKALPTGKSGSSPPWKWIALAVAVAVIVGGSAVYVLRGR